MSQSSESASPAALPDVEVLSRNVAAWMQEAGKATAAYMKPGDAPQGGPPEELGAMVASLGVVAERWLRDPQRALEAQSRLGQDLIGLWSATLTRFRGGEAEPVARPDPKDNRFRDPEWSQNPMFDFLKQAYLITSRWAERMVEEADDVDDHTRMKAGFYVKQAACALSPSNFLPTNPELIRETVKENGANLVRGMRMLAEDVAAGGGKVRLRQTDFERFKVGVNIATTLGKVVFRNDLIELLQYAPTTETVLRRPLLIVPPWINKFYVLDLNPEKSFIKWAVDQGLTVFCISWVNPDERHAEKGFEDYMREGIFAALDAIRQATGEEEVGAIGYCIGGTLLGMTLAYMAATGDRRIAHAAFFTTQVDFSQSGELKVFIDEEQIRETEAAMKERGYLEGSKMANSFNMLRPNDLIWPYVVNVYMKGQPPQPFDLLYWNSDATRMPYRTHSTYLRSCYLNNDVTEGRMELDGVRLDLGQVTIPVFQLATREDHIAPARSVFIGSKAFGGPLEYVLAGSGHIAGVVNPPAKGKYGFKTGGPVEGTLEEWDSRAETHSGSWWPYWFAWAERQNPERVPAREPGAGGLPALEDAPGSYVKVRS